MKAHSSLASPSEAESVVPTKTVFPVVDRAVKWEGDQVRCI